MDKKEVKLQYLRNQLSDPNVSEYEKRLIRQRLGIETIYSENDFVDKHGFELLCFISNYFEEQLLIIRRKKKTNSPFNFFTDLQKTIYYLSMYSGILEEDSLEQLDDINDYDEIKGLIEGFRRINRFDDAELIESLLKGRITEKKIQHLLEHFRDDENIEYEIETEIEKFIRVNTKEILDLQKI